MNPDGWGAWDWPNAIPTHVVQRWTDMQAIATLEQSAAPFWQAWQEQALRDLAANAAQVSGWWRRWLGLRPAACRWLPCPCYPSFPAKTFAQHRRLKAHRNGNGRASYPARIRSASLTSSSSVRWRMRQRHCKLSEFALRMVRHHNACVANAIVEVVDAADKTWLAPGVPPPITGRIRVVAMRPGRTAA